MKNKASKSSKKIVRKNGSSSEHMVIGNVKAPTTSELLSLRSDLRADIRSLDDLNFKIISAISTVSLGILTAGTALREADYVVFFFAGIAIVNCIAAVMLLKNRISVLEKSWYVSYLESKLPKENRQLSPFGFKHFEEPMPKTAAYRHMIRVHQILIILGFFWALASLHSFFEHSQHYIFAFAMASIYSLIRQPISDLSSLLPYDFIISLVLLIIFGLVTLYAWIDIQRGYKEGWKNSIWARKPTLLETIKRRFESANNKQYVDRGNELPSKVAEEKQRDYEIYKEIKEIYKLEWERSDRLDDKAIGVVRSAGIIMALYMGLGTFTLEHISPANIYYSLLTFVLMFGLTLFIAAIICGLFGSRIRPYKAADPRDFIDEYSKRDWIELIHYYGGDLKNAILENREINDKKAKQIRNALFALSSGSATILLYALLILFALN